MIKTTTTHLYDGNSYIDKIYIKTAPDDDIQASASPFVRIITPLKLIIWANIYGSNPVKCTMGLV